MQLDLPSNTLKQGYRLHWYQIEKVIGKGGFGITYLAQDQNLSRSVAIKEFMPEEFAARGSDNTIHPKTSDKQGIYKWGLDRFIVEARILAQFNHPNIIRVLSVFEDNNTAYMVMEYAQGRDLSKIYKEEGAFSQEQLLDVFIPIIDGLSLVHNEQFIHRDIKPANIYINTNNVPVLLDFGSARQSIGGRTQTLTNLFTYGYAPYEQYNEGSGKQGPWTDIYSLGACLYVGITGKKPLDALNRGGGFLEDGRDPYEPISLLQKNRYPENFLLAIDNALMFKSEHRPQHVLTWASMLLGETQAPPLPGFMRQTIEPGEDKTVLKPRRKDTANTGPSYNSQGLINVHGKRNTSPTLDSQLAYKQNSKQHSQKHGQPASKIMMLMILSLVIVAAVVVARYGFQLQIPIAIFDDDKNQNKPTVAKVDTDKQKNIEQLLSNANISFVQQNYTKPKNNNAFYYYTEVLNINKNNLAALKGLQKIEDQLIQDATETFNKGSLKKTKDLLAQLEVVNLDSEAAFELAYKVEKLDIAKNEIASLLSEAKILLQKQRYTSPKNNNAYVVYQKILRLKPGNAPAIKGIKIIEDRYIEQFNNNLKLSQFSQADKDIEVLARINLPPALMKTLQNNLAKARSDASQALAAKEASKADVKLTEPVEVTMNQVSQLLGTFKTAMETQQIEKLKKLSQFVPGREQFVKELFDQYKTMKVNISNVQFIPKQNKASAQIKLSDLIEIDGDQVMPGAWNRFQITMHRDKNQQLKIHW